MINLDNLTRHIGNKNNLGENNMLYESMSPFFTETFDEIIAYLEENNPEYAEYLKRMKSADKLYQGIYKAAQDAKREQEKQEEARRKAEAKRQSMFSWDCRGSYSYGGGCGDTTPSRSSWGCGSSGSSYSGGC